MHYWPPMAMITTSCQQLQWWVVLDLGFHTGTPIISSSFWKDSQTSIWGSLCVMLVPMLGRGRQITCSALIQTAPSHFFNVNIGHIRLCFYSEYMTKRHNIGLLPTWICNFLKWKICTFFCFCANFKFTIRMQQDCKGLANHGTLFVEFTFGTWTSEMTVPSCGWGRPWWLAYSWQKPC